MTKRAFRPTIARTQNSMKILNTTKTNATIRDLEEEEGELEEKEGTVVSIKRDLINGAGWTVKDKEENTYICSCASSMYEIPDTVERGGMLYPKETVEVIFTINPVLRINTIKEITSLGEETEKVDVSQWKHDDNATTVIAKPKSALSISDGFIELNYDNDNSVLANPDAVKTEGKETQINTEKLSINSADIDIRGQSLDSILQGLNAPIYNNYIFDSVNAVVDTIDNITQITIPSGLNKTTVIGELKDQQAIPLRTQTQQLITDGNCVDKLIIDENGIIAIEFETDSDDRRRCPEEKTISGTYNWITPQAVYRNYIRVVVKQTCNYCNEGNNISMEYVNYCPSCNNWNSLIDTSTSIRCVSCDSLYCQNCGMNLSSSSANKLKKYRDNYIIGYGTTCDYCNSQLTAGTSKHYINYCPNPDCKKWGFLYPTEIITNTNSINVLRCGDCQSEYCCSCGIDQKHHGLTLSDSPVQYSDYKNALRKLKYVRDGN